MRKAAMTEKTAFRKKRKLILCMVILTVLLSAFCFVFFCKRPMQRAVSAEGSDWMAGIDGEKPLSAITLPGAHDSCAWNSDFGYFSQCQSSDTAMQLMMGIRYLDIRISLDSRREALIMTHGVAVCREGGRPLGRVLTLDQVLKDCYAFLEEHPGETVVFCVKPEDDQAKCRELLLNSIGEKPELWYLENRIPTLEEVRGRLVLASRFAENPEQMGLILQWRDMGDRYVQNDGEEIRDPFYAGPVNEASMLYVQDLYCYETEEKWNAVYYGFTKKAAEVNLENHIMLQFLSTKGSGALGHPAKYADRLNARLLEQNMPAGSYGWVILDFARPELVRYIYQTNSAEYGVKNESDDLIFRNGE